MAAERIADMHRVERPRERLLARGARALSDEELLAVVLRTGCAGRGVMEVARDLLGRYPGSALSTAPVRGMSVVKGVGPSRACALAAAFELGRRRAGTEASSPAIESPRSVWRQLGEVRARRKEHFIAFYLDACSRIMHEETVSIGTLTASLVHPREVFGPAVEKGAAGVIVAHNHPSGDPSPSGEDRETTRRLAQAGKILGITLLDHVIVTDTRFYSFRERGFL